MISTQALTYGGAGADAAQKKLKEEAERAATDIARQAAQEADAARRRADAVDDDRCEMCGVDPTTRASNLTKRTLMTNAPTGQRCGHRFCGACVERGSQASKGQGSFPCPALGCGAPVRRATLDPRRLDAIEVARDASARARTLAVHNSRATRSQRGATTTIIWRNARTSSTR